MPNGKLKADAVFEGGGVKGIGLVGAVAATVERGYEFQNLAGTSAGAIVAALVAARYSPAELRALVSGLNYSDFKDKGWLDHVPLLGPAMSLGFEKGIYEGKFFEQWMRDQLAKKNVRVFGDLVREEDKNDPRYRYSLQVIASDITRGKLLVLPRDIADYGEAPDNLEVARAVRMSMSIPFFFEPVVLKDTAGNDCYIVDGGVLSNFPVWLFDMEGSPSWPTFGYKLVAPDEDQPHSVTGPITLLAALFATMMEAHDARYIEDKDFSRTIPIPTLGVRTTDFNLKREKAEELYASGYNAGQQFFVKWDFDNYKRKHRAAAPVGRRDRVLSP